MKFGEKLQALRKEKKLSQEQLAEKLNVSRQAVSKWESGQSYPEMDKMLSICKLYNISLEELTNDSIKELNFTKNKNIMLINNLVDQISSFIKKSVVMFKNMTSKNVGRFFIEFIIMFILLGILKHPFDYFNYMIDGIIKYIPENIYHIVGNTFYLVLMIVYYALSCLIIFFYFEKRWLEKYEKGELEDNPNNKVKEENTSNNINEDNEVKEYENTSSKSNGLSKVFSVLGQIIYFCFKLFIFFIAIPFCFILVFLGMGILFNLYLFIRGVLYIGPFICMIFGLLLVVIIIELFFNFIFNRKTKLNRIFICFIIGLIGVGMGIGISSIEVYSTKFIDEPVEVSEQTKDYSYNMDSKLTIVNNGSSSITYQTDDKMTDSVKVVVKYNDKYANLNVEEEDSYIYMNTYNESFNHNIQQIDSLIKDLKKREVHNYKDMYNYDVTVISSQKNIDIISSNNKNYFKGNDYIYYE